MRRALAQAVCKGISNGTPSSLKAELQQAELQHAERPHGKVGKFGISGGFG
jgi:hypothetical protein